MSKKWMWLSGWASDLSIWEDELSEAEAAANHEFISFSKIIENPDNLYQSIPGLAKADTVVAWSLGTLALMRSASKRPQGQRWILLAPVVDFCNETSGWNSKNMMLMAKQVVKIPRSTLENFMELMGPCDEEIQKAWLNTALQMNLEKLALGLEYLKDKRVETPLADMGPTEIHFGREDQVVTPEMVKLTEAVLPFAVINERPKSGHWVQTLIL